MKLIPSATNWLFRVFVVLPCLIPSQVSADEDYMVCDLADTLATSGTIADEFHEFGSDTVAHPNEFSLSGMPFSQVFELYVTDTVSERWNASEWEDIIEAIMSPDTTDMGDDVFGIVWTYFVRDDADGNDSNAFIEFEIGASTYTTVRIRMYDIADIPALGGDSSQQGDLITINATESGNHAISMESMLGQGVAHELTHVCWQANGVPREGGYNDLNETVATLAEHFMGTSRPLYYDISYDASIMRDEPCDIRSKYTVERIWISYLYEAFIGNAADPTDDLVYRWIRSSVTAEDRMKLSGLATVLWDADFDYLGGADAAERVSLMFANFLAAKFVNASAFGANGEFGLGTLNTMTDFGLFLDNCTSYFGGNYPMIPADCPGPGGYPPGHNSCWNVRILIPEYEMTADHGDTLTNVSGIYRYSNAALPADSSRDHIDVSQWGTDYIVFRAGEYYVDGEEHEFEIRITGTAKYPSPPYEESVRAKPVGWVIGYSDDETMQLHPEDLVFIEPLVFSPTTTIGATVDARPVIVTDFGRSIKAVVVAIGASATNLDLDLPYGAFLYEYDYGVFTPGALARTWEGDVYALGDVTVPDGGSLEIKAGTYVKVFNDDLAATGADAAHIELNVDGELIVSGTLADPVTIQPWTQTTSEDWAGIYFSADSEGGTFNHCTIGYAEYVIDSYAPIEIDNSTIRGASDALISMWGTTLDIDNSTIGLSNGDCIRLDDTDATIDSTIVEDAAGYGLYASGNAAINISKSTFQETDVAIYVENNTTNGTISETLIDDNDVGISYYSSTKPTIDECTITGNTTGIYLDYFSSPSILHCMTSASYSGNITGNGSGIACFDNSDPAVGHCNISSNNTGVAAFDDSEPDLDGYGENKFMSNSSYHVANLVTGTTVPATEIYWYQNTGSPNYYPSAAKILGSVDYTDALASGPSPVSPRPDPRPEPEVVVTGLGRAHPNPFNPTVQIPYGVASAGDVRIDIFDVQGRLVRTLVDERKERGNHVVVWDGTRASGSPTASAVYFVRMRTGQFNATQKIVLLK